MGVERLQHAIPLWNPQHLAGGRAVSGVEHGGSRLRPIPTGRRMCPRQTMSYLTQMFGLATHNFWSAAVGMALAIAFIRGIARREIEDAGKLLGRPDARHAVGAGADVPGVCAGAGVAGRDPELEAVRHGDAGGEAECNHNRHRWKTCNHSGTTQTIAQGRWPRRKRSRCWAPTAAASSMRIPRTRLRIRRR
jgi:hypothetical protein